MIGFRHRGDFSNLTRFLQSSNDPTKILEQYGRIGVAALESATPVDTGLTAASWYYEIRRENGKVSLCFCNSNYEGTVPIAVILQYGHATGNGGWVEGRDYINPAIQPIFDEIANKAWKEVGKS